MKFKAVAGILLKRVLPVIVGLGVLIVVIGWLAGVMVEKIEPDWSHVAVRRIDPSLDHDVYKVREVTKQYIEEAVGTLKSSKRTEVSARVLAPIDRIAVSAGQTVQAGDKLGFRFKAADKLGLVGVFRQDDLDSHLTVDHGLVGTIDRAEPTRSNPLTQLIAFDDAGAWVSHPHYPLSLFDCMRKLCTDIIAHVTQPDKQAATRSKHQKRFVMPAYRIGILAQNGWFGW